MADPDATAFSRKHLTCTVTLTSSSTQLLTRAPAKLFFAAHRRRSPAAISTFSRIACLSKNLSV